MLGNGYFILPKFEFKIQTMKKSLLIILGCAISIFVFQAFTISPKTQWKNLHILPQNISEDGLDSVMHHFTAALGVKCNYCHVRNNEINKMDFANDAKPEKLIARKMMLMSIDINKNHFNEIEEEMNENDNSNSTINTNDSVQYMLKYVTCYTCHKGDTRPKNNPPAKTEK